MGYGEEGHLNTDECIIETDRDVLRVGVRAKLGDDLCRDKDRDANRLPEREKENSFDAKKFGNRPGIVSKFAEI